MYISTMHNDVVGVYHCKHSAIVVTVCSHSCLAIVVVQLLNCKRRLAHLVWNVAVTKIALRIFCIPVHKEESISRDNKRITMTQYENDLQKDSSVNWEEQPIHSCNFWGPRPSGTGSYSRWQVSDKILVSHVYLKSLLSLKIFYFPLCFTEAHYHYSYIEGLRVGFSNKILCKVVF